MADSKRTESTRPPGPATATGPDALHLVVAWSGDQPELVGFSAPIDTVRLLGRGEAQADDPAPRTSFSSFRPSSPERGPALTGTRISRSQLLLAPAPMARSR